MVSQKYAKFHFCPVFGLFYDFIINFIVRFMHLCYEDDAFSVKKNQIPKILKFLRCLIFAQIIVPHPYFMEITTLISIWLQLNHNDSSNLLKNFSKLIFFWQFQATIMDFFFKKMKFSFLVNLHHFVEHYEARIDEEPIWSGKWDITA